MYIGIVFFFHMANKDIIMITVTIIIISAFVWSYRNFTVKVFPGPAGINTTINRNSSRLLIDQIVAVSRITIVCALIEHILVIKRILLEIIE